MKNVLLALFILLSFLQVIGQPEFKTINISNGHKFKSLDLTNKGNYFLFVEEVTYGDSVEYKLEIKGTPTFLSGNELTILAECVKGSVKYADSINYIKKQYRNLQSYTKEKIDLENISHIIYQSDRASIREEGGYAMIFIGSIVSLVVAPLISINYSNGDFRTKRYITTAGIGAGMMCIGIPLSVFNKKKEIHFKQPKDKTVKSLWKIDSFE